MLKAAASKATQFNSTVGAFEAWRASTSGNPLANFNVLMDLIMDSNLLYWAAAQSGNQTYYNEAVSNAEIDWGFMRPWKRAISALAGSPGARRGMRKLIVTEAQRATR